LNSDALDLQQISTITYMSRADDDAVSGPPVTQSTAPDRPRDRPCSPASFRDPRESRNREHH
jgi:hypothetical protein